MPKIGNDWDEIIGEEFTKDYYIKLREFLKAEYTSKAIYPNMHDIFNSLKLTGFRETKVVILGQDPYIKPGEAHGLSFSVKPGVKIPPSLLNIFKELKNDLGCEIPNSGCLEKWAARGVLMLNAVLTVRAGESNSHKNKGWENFTSRVIQTLDEHKDKPVVFMLWGNNAKEKEALICNRKHLILKAAHPSPLAGGAFFGCKHFSKANNFLTEHGIEPVDWQL